MEKLDPEAVYTAVVRMPKSTAGTPVNIKRFCFEPATLSKDAANRNFVGPDNTLLLLMKGENVLLNFEFAKLIGKSAKDEPSRAPMEIASGDFVEVKGFAAKGKRATLFDVEEVTGTLIHDTIPEEEEAEEHDAAENGGNEVENFTAKPKRSEQDLMDELTGQGHLFSDDDF